MANSRLCSIPDCGKPLWSKGYCSAHYMRMRAHGDPLAGGTSHGEPLRFTHEIAILHTGDGCLTWPFSKNGKGYGSLYVDGKPIIASRYVCELVNGPPPTPEHEAAHNCGKGHEGCIAPGHLEWKTHKENMADKVVHGTNIRVRGERHHSAKLTEAEVREIRSLKGEETERAMAARFGVSNQTIHSILRRQIWAWVS
ncbi:hypothetical protein RJJ65_32030 [Rhizobium hidalgonense]|uniref:HNH nuclease domain-containing protein n=1 Tax=Rhizobium hidalgonense TaxID=1538159 RepID=A0AAJ2GWE5_9HYPH|nr:hypothetical protein [Rhizobium hidalgonense]MDR9777187.1 hypothetical protein [Rhizobium hidalgonense]